MIPTASRFTVWLTVLIVQLTFNTVFADQWLVQKASPAFNFSHTVPAKVSVLKRASSRWKLCVLYPHLKDSYWLSVNYGMVDQAKKLGVQLKVMAADGYNSAGQQRNQLQSCRNWQADAILLGSVGYDLLNQSVEQTASSTPVFGLVNNLSPKGVSGKVGVDWYQMGFRIGQHLSNKHPRGSKPATVAWFSSPTGRGGSDVSLKGLRAGLEGSSVVIVSESWGDNDSAIKRDLIQKTLDQHPQLDYLVGGAVMAEVAIPELIRRKLTGRTQVISTYMSHSVYRGLLRHRILLANDDNMVLQGRLSVDQAIKFLEKKPWFQDLGPDIRTLSSDSLPDDLASSLSPASWRPVYDVSQKTVSVNR
ncbi:TMAO reductase system periplasmic protein TorT [Endozoicomonas sp. OPT23]|uniref:TMAO reductase system periplasmic protein TorT n=1 Tax=Endozoicomonas sp. OPT23 TaxID=2072845 RepID=UPI001891A5F0|nr:TMAO reductase system periplasmic protein TorT [Endozoicomonas sp. OPT23]